MPKQKKLRGKEISGCRNGSKSENGVLATKQECVKMALDRVKQNFLQLSEQEYACNDWYYDRNSRKRRRNYSFLQKIKQNEALMSKMAEKENVVVAGMKQDL